MTEFDLLKSNLSQYGQEHLVKFWSTLNEQERKQLTDDINRINFEAVIKDFKRITTNSHQDKLTVQDAIKPVPESLSGGYNKTSENLLKCYEQDGLCLISAGKVGVLVLAGGQGTRLGVTYPKGNLLFLILSF